MTIVLLQISGTLCHDDTVLKFISLIGNKYRRTAFPTEVSMHCHTRIRVAIVICSDMVAAVGDIELLSGRVMSTTYASELNERLDGHLHSS